MRSGLSLAVALLAVMAPSIAKARSDDQLVLGGGPSVEGAAELASDDGELNLASLLAIQRDVSLFYDYLRSISHVNERTMVGLQKTTLFAPSNPTILHLSRKPHQGEPSSSSAYSSEEDKEKADFAFLDRWVSTHAVEDLIAPSDLRDTKEERKNMDGKVVKIECPSTSEGEVRTSEGSKWKGCKVAGAEIIAFAEAANGVVYTIDGVIPVQD